jgi:hypothetical protein
MIRFSAGLTNFYITKSSSRLGSFCTAKPIADKKNTQNATTPQNPRIYVIIPKLCFSKPVDPGSPIACKNIEINVRRMLSANANAKDIAAIFFRSNINTKMKSYGSMIKLSICRHL